MSSSLIKEKFRAAGIHLLITALVAAAVIAFVTNFWYPYGTLKLLKGWNLFLLLLICDVALGPVLSLVVFNPQKPRREKWMDYGVIVIVQLAALAYGLHAVSQNRLLFLVFTADRFEAVTAGELADSDLQAGSAAKWRNPGMLNHFVVSVNVPRPDSPDYVDWVMSGLDGRDLQYFPARYQELNASSHLLRHIKPVSALAPAAQRLIEDEVRMSSSGHNLAWLPLSHDRQFWTLIVHPQTGQPIRAINLDPYEHVQ